MNWKRTQVLVRGGASFIASALVDALIERGATVRIVDNLSSGQLHNIQAHIKSGTVDLFRDDLLDREVARRSTAGVQVVFLLAADHGGRGYVDRHQVACSTNLILDGLLFCACHEAGVEKVVYASSGCVYPNFLQTDPREIVYLTEDKAGPPYEVAAILDELLTERTPKHRPAPKEVVAGD